jgi:hypothetical protein
MKESTARAVRLVPRIGLFILLGTPLVAHLWETLNLLFAGIVQPVRLLTAIPAALVLFLLLRAMARSIESWQEEVHPTFEGEA